MADPFPKIPLGNTPDGTEMVVARQGGLLRRFALSSLLPYFKGAKGDKGDQGPVGPQGAIGPQEPNPWIDLGTFAVKETLALAIGASVRTVPITVTGAKKGSSVTVFPASSLTQGFGLVGAVCTADDTVNVLVQCPPLALGTTYNLSVRVLVART